MSSMTLNMFIDIGVHSNGGIPISVHHVLFKGFVSESKSKSF